jgi:hypothetical protein
MANFFDSLFNSLDNILGPSSSGQNSSSDTPESEPVREVRIEGRESQPHEHDDGSHGTDTYAAKVIYENGEKVHESNAEWGHISNGSDNPDHVK